MEELECYVEDLGFSSLYSEEPLRSSIYFCCEETKTQETSYGALGNLTY